MSGGSLQDGQVWHDEAAKIMNSDEKYTLQLAALKRRYDEVTQVPAPGIKHDNGKPMIHLVPKELIESAARAFGYGAKKYSEYNWLGGIALSRLFSALMRHLWAWWAGEERDEESGLSHLDHAAACLGMMIAMSQRKQHDDRPATIKEAAHE